MDPALVERRVEVRISQREITAVALDSGELACRHERSFAKHRTITALEHARTLRVERRPQEQGLDVEVRSLSAYDRLIA
ncbi:MAG: Mu transposase domain-containing protein [Solirubrobacteraceae bacterium]